MFEGFRTVRTHGNTSASGNTSLLCPRSTTVSTHASAPYSRRKGSPYPAFIHLLVTTYPSRPPGVSRFSPSS